MSLSKTTLAAIQQAGQGLHKATVVVAAAVREQAQHLVNTVSSQPFQAEGEQAFANFKMLARLSQDLQTLEEQLRGLYATASELASPEMDVVVALPRQSARASAASDVAEDAVIKPAGTRSTKPRKVRNAKVQVRAAKPKGAGKSAPQATALTANDQRVLDYLKTALTTNSWTKLTGAVVARSAGLPLGSVAVSIKKVLQSGAIRKSGTSSYQLAR